MPIGWGFWGGQTERRVEKVVGRPKRNRSKNKAQRQARKRTR